MRIQILLVYDACPRFRPIANQRGGAPTSPDFFFRPTRHLSNVFANGDGLHSSVCEYRVVVSSGRRCARILHFSFISAVFCGSGRFHGRDRLQLAVSTLPFVVSCNEGYKSSLCSDKRVWEVCRGRRGCRSKKGPHVGSTSGGTVLMMDFNADCRGAHGLAVRTVRRSVTSTFPTYPACHT